MISVVETTSKTTDESIIRIYIYINMSTPKVICQILSLMSDKDIGGIAVEYKPSHLSPIIFLCHAQEWTRKLGKESVYDVEMCQ